MIKNKHYKGRVFIFAAVVLMFASLQLYAQSGEKPNVVLMLADNVGYGDIGAFQGGDIRGMPTPNIDRLASEGLILTQFIDGDIFASIQNSLLRLRGFHR